MKTLAERLAELAAKIGPMRARMKAIHDAAEGHDDGEGREMTAAEAKEFDDLAADVSALEARMRRLKAMDESAQTATVVRGVDPDEASRSRGTVPAQVAAPKEKGLGFARLVKCYAMAKGNISDAIHVAKSRYPNERVLQAILKAQVPGATGTDPSWAGPLVEPTNLISEFIEWLAPQTIIGRFGAGNIPALRRVPFNISVPAQTSTGEGAWTGEGRAIRLTSWAYDRVTLRYKKVGSIAVLSEELIRHSGPSADVLVRDELGQILVRRLDVDFISPTVTEQTDIRPASITNGSGTSASSGPAIANIKADIRTAISAFIAANIDVSGLVIVMRNTQALSLSLMLNALGQPLYPQMTAAGGVMEGFPVIASQHMPTGVVAFVAAGEILIADDGGVAVDMSREASLEMDTAPSNLINNGASPPVSVEQTMVSMFQTESVALRAIRVIDWKKRRTAATYYLTGCSWGSEVTSPPAAAL